MKPLTQQLYELGIPQIPTSPMRNGSFLKVLSSYVTKAGSMTSELALQLIHCTGSWGKREVGRILPFSCSSLCQAGLGRVCPGTQTPTSANKTVTTLLPKMKSLEHPQLLVSHSTDDELPSPFSHARCPRVLLLLPARHHISGPI